MSRDGTDPAASPSSHPHSGFASLLVTQFFGAANDNILKGVLAFAVAAGGIWAASLGDGGQGWVGLCLTLPFIAFSGWGGQIADRTSKRDLTVGLKIAEVAVVAVAGAAFLLGSVWLAVFAMVLMATQSAFFGPVKYGMIPELVRGSRLSGANGTINLFTNLAIIAGTVAAGPIYDALAPPVEGRGVSGWAWLPGAVMVAVAVLGVVASLGLPRLRAATPELRFDWNPVGTYWRSLREMARGPLLATTLAWAFFYLIGMLVLLILPDYRELLGTSAAVAANLLGVVAIAIGVGSLLAGVLSGRRIRPVLSPLGGLGMAISMTVLAFAPRDAVTVGVLLLPLGLAAGFYIVPLQAMLQKLSPDERRGRFLGTANAISFVASSGGSLLFLACRRGGMPADRVFLVAAAASLVAAIGLGLWWWRVGRDQCAGRLSAPADPS
ncbi:MAG: MFS transporter [Phycisphaerales bacterium]